MLMPWPCLFRVQFHCLEWCLRVGVYVKLPSGSKHSQGWNHGTVLAGLQAPHMLFPMLDLTFLLFFFLLANSFLSSSYSEVPSSRQPSYTPSGRLSYWWAPRLLWACFHQNPVILIVGLLQPSPLLGLEFLSEEILSFLLVSLEPAGSGTLQALSKYSVNKLIKTRPSDLLWVTF